uniref:Zinc finger and BTB domain containing 22a n=1 Tax=Cyclopterus lumpus TaxID=8103 RepID=A0A8C2ZWN0_CYCLU
IASAAPAGLTVQVCFPGARAAVLDNLNRQREEGRLCDLSIQVQGQCVVSAISRQVLLKNVTTVSLPSVMDPVAFESVLSSAYTGQLSIVHDDIVNYVTVASFLQMWHIVDKCTEILKRPRPSTEASHGEAAAAHPGTASRHKDEDEDEEEEEDADFEYGTGQVSQRPLVPASPDFTMAGSEVNWPSAGTGQGSSSTPTSSRHLSPSSAAFPPPSSPPTPSSSSSVSLAGAPYTGKVHFCHCGKAYTLKSMRDRHVKMQHLNLRPFGCPVCTKSFKMKHHLTKHLKTHGGLRPYECGLCGKKVIWRDSFLRSVFSFFSPYNTLMSGLPSDVCPCSVMDHGLSLGLIQLFFPLQLFSCSVNLESGCSLCYRHGYKQGSIQSQN